MIRSEVIAPYKHETDDYIVLDSFNHARVAYSIMGEIAPDSDFYVKQDVGAITTNAAKLTSFDTLPIDIVDQLKERLQQGVPRRFMYYTLNLDSMYLVDDKLKLFPTEEFSFDNGSKRQSARLSQIHPIYKQQTDLPRYTPYADNDMATIFPRDMSYRKYLQLATSGFYLGSHIDHYFGLIGLLLHPLYYSRLSDTGLSSNMRTRLIERRGYTDPETVFYVLRGEQLHK